MSEPRDTVTTPSREDPLLLAASEVVGGPAGRRSAGHPWWTPVRVVLAVACVAWLLAMLQKAPCAADGWGGDNSRYAQMCYSDVPFLYVPRGFAERQVPFADSGGQHPRDPSDLLLGVEQLLCHNPANACLGIMQSQKKPQVVLCLRLQGGPPEPDAPT